MLMRRALIVLAVMATPSLARADRVVASASRWNGDGTRIYTDVTIEHDDGTSSLVTVPGGSVGGIAMKLFDVLAPDAPPREPDTQLAIDFVREKTKQGKTPLHWKSGCVYITPDSAGVSDLPGTESLDIIKSVLANMRAQTHACSYLRFQVDLPKPTKAQYDGTNTILFREDKWCRPPANGDPEECYTPSQIAVTTIFYNDTPGMAGDGVILDTDTEVDAVDWAISACDPVSGACTTAGDGPNADLANTLAHEVGHMMGLDHTCWDGSVSTPPTDNDGNPVPNCFPAAALPASVTESTMYNFQSPAETKKATLEPDDIAGVCAIYPIADDPMECKRAPTGGGGGCAVGRRGPDEGVLILLIGCVPLVRRRWRSAAIRATGSK